MKSVTMLQQKWAMSEKSYMRNLGRLAVGRRTKQGAADFEVELEIAVDIKTETESSFDSEQGHENEYNDGPLVSLPVQSDTISIFFSIFPPSISLYKYVTRVLEYTKVSEGVYIHALVLLQRMEKKDDRLVLTEYNVHRLLITAVMISIKFLEHAWYSNKFYAQVGGVPTLKEINKMEVTMLSALNYNVFVDLKEIHLFKKQKQLGLFHELLSSLSEKNQDKVS